MVQALEASSLLSRRSRLDRVPSRRDRGGCLRLTAAAAAVCFADERAHGGPSAVGGDSFEWGGRGEESVECTLRGVKKPLGRRVLVVDDEPSMRLLCTINLTIAGFEVGEAVDGAQALELAAAEAFDLVLLDVMLPDMGGHDVARRLKADARTRPIPIVFLSARTDKNDLRAGFALGAVDYITKPFDPIVLAARVEEILERVDREEADSYRRERLAELGE